MTHLRSTFRKNEFLFLELTGPAKKCVRPRVPCGTTAWLASILQSAKAFLLRGRYACPITLIFRGIAPFQFLASPEFDGRAPSGTRCVGTATRECVRMPRTA